MKFGPVPVRESCGAILAHSLRVGKSKWKKGRVLSAEDSEALAQEGLSQIVAARAEPGDIGENQAAARVAKIVAGKNIRAAAPVAGRANFFAQADGLLQFNPAAVSATQQRLIRNRPRRPPARRPRPPKRARRNPQNHPLRRPRIRPAKMRGRRRKKRRPLRRPLRPPPRRPDSNRPPRPLQKHSGKNTPRHRSPPRRTAMRTRRRKTMRTQRE